MRRSTMTAAAALALLAGCGGKGTEPAPERLPVETVAVQPEGAASGEDRFAATLHRDREARLGFRAGGTIAAFPARAGDRLGAGATLARLDATALAANVARAAAEVERLTRAASRYGQLAEAGAVGDAQARDSASGLAAARAALAAARFDAAGAHLVMPFAGVVLRRSGEVGEVVAPGAPVVEVADLSSPLIAVADFPAERAARLIAGASAQLILAGHAPIAVRLRRTPGGADPASGMVRAEFLVPAAAGLASGMTGSLALAAPAASLAEAAAGTIPVEALLWARGGKAGVFVVDAAGRARSREVRLLGLAGARARIAGLPAGTRVITLGAGFARDGQPVEAVAK